MSTSPKVAAGGASGAVVLIVVWILSACGVDVPPEIASALTVLVGALAGWLTPDHLRELGALHVAGRHEAGRVPTVTTTTTIAPSGDSLA